MERFIFYGCRITKQCTGLMKIENEHEQYNIYTSVRRLQCIYE